LKKAAAVAKTLLSRLENAVIIFIFSSNEFIQTLLLKLLRYKLTLVHFFSTSACGFIIVDVSSCIICQLLLSTDPYIDVGVVWLPIIIIIVITLCILCFIIVPLFIMSGFKSRERHEEKLLRRDTLRQSRSRSGHLQTFVDFYFTRKSAGSQKNTNYA